jgi:ribosomal protein L32
LTERRRRRRAAEALQQAPLSVCPHCKRETKTVSGGICADCWSVKDPDNAVFFPPEPKTEPLFDWGAWAGDWIPIGAFVAAAIAVVAVLAKLFFALF